MEPSLFFRFCLVLEERATNVLRSMNVNNFWLNHAYSRTWWNAFIVLRFFKMTQRQASSLRCYRVHSWFEAASHSRYLIRNSSTTSSLPLMDHKTLFKSRARQRAQYSKTRKKKVSLLFAASRKGHKAKFLSYVNNSGWYRSSYGLFAMLSDERGPVTTWTRHDTNKPKHL